MLWKSLYHFNIHLHMVYPIIVIPRERDQVVMDIFFSKSLDTLTIRRFCRCRVALEVLFLSDMTTADGRYLEEFVFTPGDRERALRFKFPCEHPTCADWNLWFNFLAQFHNHRRQTKSTPWQLAATYPSHMEVVLLTGQ